MTADAQQDSLTCLSYGQLIQAMNDSNGQYETRMDSFDAACTAARAAIDAGHTYAEARAEMDSTWAAARAQAAMTRAIAAEITARIRRNNYA